LKPCLESWEAEAPSWPYGRCCLQRAERVRSGDGATSENSWTRCYRQALVLTRKFDAGPSKLPGDLGDQRCAGAISLKEQAELYQLAAASRSSTLPKSRETGLTRCCLHRSP